MLAPALALFCATAPSAPQQVLVKNINLNQSGSLGIDRDSEPTGFVRADGWVWFSAMSPFTGRELFRVPFGGGEAQLVANIAFGLGDGEPLELTPLPDGRVVFTAETTATGREAWVTDGAEAGTLMLAELTSGWSQSEPTGLVEHDGLVFFFASDDANPTRGLYRTDGTPSGTFRITDLEGGGSYLAFHEQAVSTDDGLFVKTDWSPTHWRIRHVGASGVATTLATVGKSFCGLPSELHPAGARVVWESALWNNGREPWGKDATTGQPVPIDVFPGASGSDPFDLTSVGGRVYFRARDLVAGREIFRTDGTVAGTERVTDFVAPDGGQPVPQELWEAGGALYFTIDAGNGTGQALWRTTGAFDTEVLFAEAVPGPESGDPTDVAALGAGVAFLATTADEGTELWYGGGTPATTYLVASLAFGADSPTIDALTSFESELWFSYDSAMWGVEPWLTDGTAAGTQLAADVAQVATDGGSFPEHFLSLGDRIVFVAEDGAVGPEPWASDGTEAGTVLLADITPGWNHDEIEGFTRVGGLAFFCANDGVHGFEPWVTDGTPAGTKLLVDLSSGPSSSSPSAIAVWRGEVYFRAFTDALGFELYATDGTAAGTRLVADLVPGPASSIVVGAIGFGDHLYFSNVTAATGGELWRTDGTAAGTALFVELAPGPAYGMVSLLGAVLGEHLYFSGSANGIEREVYRTDGTVAGTGLFLDLAAAGSSNPGWFRRAGDRIVVSAQVGGSWQYWSFGADGSAEQLTFAPLVYECGHDLYPAGDRLIGRMTGPGNSKQLIVTDGTAAGTSNFLQLSPSAAPFDEWEGYPVTSGGKLVFKSADLVFGEELWVTDGTAAGTFPITTLQPGAGWTLMTDSGRMGDLVFTTGFDSQVGNELFTVPLAVVGDWVAQRYGAGCAGSDGTPPDLGASGSAALGGTLVLEVSEAPPGAPVGAYFSNAYGLADLGGCDLYLAAPVPLAGGLADGAGRASIAIPIPSAPSTAGYSTWVQVAVVDIGATLFGLASLTPALEVVLEP